MTMNVRDLNNIRVNGCDTLWCGACQREVVKLTSWQLPDIIEAAQRHLVDHHNMTND